MLQTVCAMSHDNQKHGPDYLPATSTIPSSSERNHTSSAFVSNSVVPRRNRTSLSGKKAVVCAVGLGHVRKPRTIGIAGAGIGGLTTALALLKTSGTGVEHITIFEPRDALDHGLGGALNINGGAAILSKYYGLDMWKIGRPMTHVTAMDTTGSTLFEVDIQKQLNANPLAKELLTSNGSLLFMTIMRDRLQQLLCDEVEKHAAIIHRGSGNKVLGVKQEQGKARCLLASGKESELFDLVIGADGIRSNIRGHVAPNTKPPQYSGIRVQWAIAPPGRCELQRHHVEQWFGNGGYVLRYAAGPESEERELLALSFRDTERTAENATYKSENAIRNDCEERFLSCGMPEVVMDAFRRSTTFIETSVYHHDRIRTWSRGGVCTLVGDSAHAMPPFLGQGANQAIQDGHALALSIARIGRDFEGLPQALRHYESRRKVTAETMIQSSRIIGLIETQGGPLGVAVRNNLFCLAGATGAAGHALIQAATPVF